jgi:hypothetical protein
VRGLLRIRVAGAMTRQLEANLAFVDASPAHAMASGLRACPAGTIELALQVTGADLAWTTPRVHSQAGRELVEEERRPEPVTSGSRRTKTPVNYGELPGAAEQELTGLGPDWTCHPVRRMGVLGRSGSAERDMAPLR